jgi:hypothetical protein
MSTEISGKKSVVKAAGKLNTSVPKNWDLSKIEEEFFKAFERGEAHARKQDREKIHAALIKNIEKATTLSEGIFHTSKTDFGVNTEKAFIKVVSVNHYEALFAVQKSDYLKPQMLEVYKKSHSIKTKFSNTDFSIDFKFMPIADHINIELINSDGFIFEYAGQ